MLKQELIYFSFIAFKGMVDQEQEITDSNLNTVTKEQLQEWKEKGFSDSFSCDAMGCR